MSSPRARANASSPHGYQSTGLWACCSRYGLVSPASRFGRSLGHAAPVSSRVPASRRSRSVQASARRVPMDRGDGRSDPRARRGREPGARPGAAPGAPAPRAASACSARSPDARRGARRAATKDSRTWSLVDLDRADGRGTEVVRRDPRRRAAAIRVLAASAEDGPERRRGGARGRRVRRAARPSATRRLLDVFRRALAGELVLPGRRPAAARRSSARRHRDVTDGRVSPRSPLANARSCARSPTGASTAEIAVGARRSARSPCRAT